MNSVICTLYEGHYHFGVASLANSLYSNGFRGDIYIGLKGDLPFWAKMAKTENQIQNQMAKTENHKNQIVKMVKIQNTIKTMAINPQQDNLLTETVSKKTKVVTLLFRL